MDLQELTKYIESHPWAMRNSASLLAKRKHASIEDVRKAKLIVKANSKLKNRLISLPRILIFDVETAPMEAYIWSLRKQNVAFDHVIAEWYMLCWSAKWLYSAEVIGDRLTPEEALEKDDKRIVNHLWELINQADIVVAYNGKKADIPWMNTRFILNGLLPPKPYNIIDPCEVARKLFGFPSNKLDALAKYFGYDAKLDTDFDLWRRCIHGDDEALEYMLTYNKRDVTLLEEVYIKLRPWIKNIPNHNNYGNQAAMVCCTCGSDNFISLEQEYYHTQIGKYQLYRCEDCGAVFRGRKNLNINSIKAMPSLK